MKNINIIELSGIIKYDYTSDFHKIKLIQKDGYKIDLILRFQEACESYRDHKVQVDYWLSDKRCSKNKMIENVLKKLCGAIDANYERNDYQYSSRTSGTDYDETLKIGNHNLYDELRKEDGRFMIIKITFKK